MFLNMTMVTGWTVSKIDSGNGCMGQDSGHNEIEYISLKMHFRTSYTIELKRIH